MRGLADSTTGVIKDMGERDFIPGAGEILFFAPSATPATDLIAFARTWRVDPDGSLRPATPPEQVAFDAELVQRDERVRESMEFDSNRMLRAIVLWVAGKLSIPPAQARTEILTIYRSL